MAVVRLFLCASFVALSLSNCTFSLSEAEILLKLKKSFSNSSALDDWIPGSSPCEKQWVGIICIEGVITGIHLYGLGLSGSIDIEALQQIENLRSISFANNSFSGPIPLLNKLGAIKSLLLVQNQFSGEIPDDFFEPMSSLKKAWLSRNNFTGKIPVSLMNLPHLKEVHLEGNGFSGSIPPLKYPKMVTSFDLSYNELEGEIPTVYSTFNAKSFLGNQGLCGKPLETECSRIEQAPTSSQGEKTSPPPSKGGGGFTIVIVVIIAIGLLAIGGIAIARKRHQDDDFSILSYESQDDVVVLPVSENESSKRPSASSRKGSGSTKRGSHHNSNDLVMINGEKGIFTLHDLMKASAEVLGSGGLGSAYKAMLSNGSGVVVKRIREMNASGKDKFEVEMRRFGRVRHRHILTPLAYYYTKEEKLLVSEFVPKGSLLYVLHGDRGICHAELNWPTRLNIIKGIASAMRYLHSEYASYNLPHGNLKSSNVLLNNNYEALLNDYALDPLINQNHATKQLFAYKSPEYIQTKQVSPKSDVYCLGIIILEVLTGKFPTQYLSNGQGGTDVVQWALQASEEKKEEELMDPEILRNSSEASMSQMVQLLRIGIACAESNPTQRLDMGEAIRGIEILQA